MHMANLYGSMTGARTAGLVGHDEMAAQVATHKGTVRVWMDKDGNFEVYVADEEGENGYVAIRGNADARTVADAGAKAINVQALAHKLDPIVVRNRAKAYGTDQTPTPTPSGPTGKKKTTTATKTRAKKQPGEGPKKAKASPEKVLDAADMSKDQKVRLVHLDPTSKLVGKVEVGDTGVIEKVKATSPLGPQVTVQFDGKGAHVLFPDSGDRLVPFDPDAPAPAEAEAEPAPPNEAGVITSGAMRKMIADTKQPPPEGTRYVVSNKNSKHRDHTLRVGKSSGVPGTAHFDVPLHCENCGTSWTWDLDIAS